MESLLFVKLFVSVILVLTLSAVAEHISPRAAGLLAGFMILVIIATANFVGSRWAGLFSAFPSTLFPLILIVHLTYDKAHVHTIIKNFPLGMGSLITYLLCVSIVYPVSGIYIGTVISLAAASVFPITLIGCSAAQDRVPFGLTTYRGWPCLRCRVPARWCSGPEEPASPECQSALITPEFPPTPLRLLLKAGGHMLCFGRERTISHVYCRERYCSDAGEVIHSNAFPPLLSM